MEDKFKENSRWHLIYTKYNQENIVRNNLENQGFIAYLPCIGLIDKAKDLITKIEVMFPRYIFVRFNIQDDDWPKIKFTKGVSHIVKFGNRLATIDEKIIKFFKRNSDKDGIFYQQQRISNYVYGEKLTIENGLLRGKEAIFISEDGKKRAKILLDIMSNNIVTNISKEDIGGKTNNEIKYSI
tara:strand:+ start:23 stop:571 length:549 start_codon:yes stop_codon:yes gene_type:complete